MLTPPHAAGNRSLSVVLAIDGAAAKLADRMEAIAESCTGLDAELIVVHPSAISPRMAAAPPMTTRVIPAEGVLVPLLWGRGIVAAAGEFVALTTSQFRVRRGWAHGLLSAFEDDTVVGVGGRISLASGTGVLGRATYLLRYAEHLPGAPLRPAAEPAGENAAYRRRAVLDVCREPTRGFWEIEAHRAWREGSLRLAHAPEAVCDFMPDLNLGGMLRNRFVHGGRFGAYRVAELKWPRWRALAVTPLVPLVLVTRILARVREARLPLGPVATALPALLTLAAAWGLGEGWGAARTPARTSRGS